MTENGSQRSRPVIKSVAFTESEWERAERRFTLSEARSFGEFARRAILDNGIVVRRVAFDPKPLGAELARIGNNINQIARLVNTESVTTLEQLKATRALVREIQALIERAVEAV